MTKLISGIIKETNKMFDWLTEGVKYQIQKQVKKKKSTKKLPTNRIHSHNI